MSRVQQLQRETYARQGVDISMKKAQHREPCVIRMGAEVDGVKGRLGAPKGEENGGNRLRALAAGTKAPHGERHTDGAGQNGA